MLASSLPSFASVPVTIPSSAATVSRSGDLAAMLVVSCSRNGWVNLASKPAPKKVFIAFCLLSCSNCFCTSVGSNELSNVWAISLVSCTPSSIEPRKARTASRYSLPASTFLSSSLMSAMRLMLPSVCSMFPAAVTSMSSKIGRIFRHISP